ncbi:hypothetical protein [Phyllobacterium sp. 22552]|uniref:hypothetical protein n=1 Tax=Phyllobacterium sp. 22552 TaxID=3453941 RepID=UPI003F83316F
MNATVESLTAQKTALKTEFDGLVKKRIAATKSGKTFDGGTELQRIQSEIAVIDEALPVVQAEEDAEYERELAELQELQLQQKKDVLQDENKRRSVCIKLAEEHAAMMVGFISEALKTVDQIDSSYRSLGVPHENLRINTEDRLAARLCRKLSKIHSNWGTRNTFGNLSWGNEQPREESWVDEEDYQFNRQIDGVLNVLKMKKEG